MLKQNLLNLCNLYLDSFHRLMLGETAFSIYCLLVPRVNEFIHSWLKCLAPDNESIWFMTQTRFATTDTIKLVAQAALENIDSHQPRFKFDAQICWNICVPKGFMIQHWESYIGMPRTIFLHLSHALANHCRYPEMIPSSSSHSDSSLTFPVPALAWSCTASVPYCLL